MTDEDIFNFIKIIERALTSDDPGVKKSLTHLLLVCSMLVQDDQESGPITNYLNNLEHRVSNLESQIRSMYYENNTTRMPTNDLYKHLKPYWSTNTNTTGLYNSYASKSSSGEILDREIDKSINDILLKQLIGDST